MFGTEGWGDSWPHVTNDLLRLNRDLLITEQVRLHLTWVLEKRHIGGIKEKAAGKGLELHMSSKCNLHCAASCTFMS